MLGLGATDMEVEIERRNRVTKRVLSSEAFEIKKDGGERGKTHLYFTPSLNSILLLFCFCFSVFLFPCRASVCLRVWTSPSSPQVYPFEVFESPLGLGSKGGVDTTNISNLWVRKCYCYGLFYRKPIRADVDLKLVGRLRRPARQKFTNGTYEWKAICICHLKCVSVK